MGKWAEVYCDCPNRTPLAGSDSYFGRPHRQKHRLTKKEKEEVERWERATKQMFACGHRSGLVIELSPGNIILLGNLLESIFLDEGGTFEVFAKVGNWRYYDDELLLIEPDEAVLWQMEIDEIQGALQGFGNLAQDKTDRLLVEFHLNEVGSRRVLESRLDEISETMPFAPVVSLKRNLQQWKEPELESSAEKIMEALADATKLCNASIETRNPIRLLW